MSWQSALACWFLRRRFKPGLQHLRSIDVERARADIAGRGTFPRVPRGWRLRETGDDAAAPLRGEWLEPPAPLAASASTLLYLHGGGYYFCSPRTHRPIVYGLARRAGLRAFSLDYRLAPEHRFPAALDDALAAYRRLLANGVAPGAIVLAGDSAGGGLALATLIALRDAGEPLPAACVLFSPWTDLAATGASLATNDGLDPMFAGDSVARAARLYLGDAPATHPYASPLYADFHGLPPLKIFVGGTEVLLDDSRRVAERAREAGVPVDLEIWPRMPHVWPIFEPFIPEAGRALDRAARFARDALVKRAASQRPGEASMASQAARTTSCP